MDLMELPAEDDLDREVRSLNGKGDPQDDVEKTNALEKLLTEALVCLADAEREVTIRKNKVVELQGKLASLLQSQSTKDTNSDEKSANKDTTSQKSKEIRRKWRILGAKVRVGVTTAVVRRRNLNDANTFLDRETQEASKEDKLDLEGNTDRQSEVKKKWRRAGGAVGLNLLQGRDCAF